MLALNQFAIEAALTAILSPKQIIAYILGKVLEEVIPRPGMKLLRFEIPDTNFWRCVQLHSNRWIDGLYPRRFMNPGQFSEQ